MPALSLVWDVTYDELSLWCEINHEATFSHLIVWKGAEYCIKIVYSSLIKTIRLIIAEYLQTFRLIHGFIF